MADIDVVQLYMEARMAYAIDANITMKHPLTMRSRSEAVRLGPGSFQAGRGQPRAWIRPGWGRVTASLDPSRPEAVRLEPGSLQARAARGLNGIVLEQWVYVFTH